MLRFSLLFCLFSYIALAQPVSFGVTGGVPISPHSQSYSQVCIGLPPYICGGNTLLFRPYTIGPTVELHLPWRVSVQAGVLYERFHKDITDGWSIRHFVDFGHQIAASANALLVPLQMKYTFRQRGVAPFVNAGATLRHLGDFDGKGYRLDDKFQPEPLSTFHFESGRDLDVALTVGGGVRWRLALFDFSPEIRFLHWTATFNQPVQNQGMLMLTVSFPAMRR